MAELSQGVFSRELARAAAQEILVAPLLRSLLFGARAGFGLAHILQCLAVLKGCGGVARAAGGAGSSELDNILASKLYRPGSVAYVSRSGGMSNELNNIISRTTDGVYEGVAIGGDRYELAPSADTVFQVSEQKNCW